MTAIQVDPETVATGVTGDQAQYLTFVLAGEEYGVDILRVQEIKGWDSATPIPNTPDYIRGVINLRGTIVPIVDLRRRFELPPADYGPTTVVIVLKVQSADRMRILIGAIGPEAPAAPTPPSGAPRASAHC